MIRGEDFMKKAKCKSSHCSSMSTSAWCDVNSKDDILKYHDLGHEPECNNQKQITSTPKQFQLGGPGFKKTMKKFLKVLKKDGRNSVNPDWK